jgi:hypothetical protein
VLLLPATAVIAATMSLPLQTTAKSAPLLNLLMSWWYVMSVFGVFLFGGRVCNFNIPQTEYPERQCVVSEAEMNTGYALGGYFNLSYNDFGRCVSLITYTFSFMNTFSQRTESRLSGEKRYTSITHL